MIKKLKFMPDYFCYPIWHDDGVEFGDIDLDELPISQELKNELLAWATTFDDGLNMEDPANSFWKEGEYECFTKKGDILLEKLRAELGDAYEIKRGNF